MRSLKTRMLTAAVIGLTALGMTACSNSKPTEESGAASGPAAQSAATSGDSEVGTWPRTVTHERGETTIEAQPKRIVSTTPSVTGTLLAIDAPVVASAATSVSEITDDKGFFAQWSEAAAEKNVDVLYDNLEFNMEALIASEPDLVIVSAKGADSVDDHYDEIAAMFPTIEVDYAKQSWQDLAKQLGEATGLEEQAEKAVADFDSYAADAKAKIDAPEGGISIVSYNGPGEQQGIGKVTSAHAQLMEQLGLEIIPADDALDASKRARQDFTFVTYENLTKAIGGNTVFLLTGTQETADSFMADATLANLPAVKSKQVYGLGETSFRIDYYSGKLLIDTVVKALS